MRVVMTAYLVVALAGCASQGNVVRCDGRLEPINMPVPRAVQTVAPARKSDAARSSRE